jgi:hypothetical protein
LNYPENNSNKYLGETTFFILRSDPKAIELNLIPPTFNHKPSVGKLLSDKLKSA